MLCECYTVHTMRRKSITRIVAENMKKVRLTKHMTQEEVAEKASITTNHYARIERGEVSPSLETLAALIKGLSTKSSKILPF